MTICLSSMKVCIRCKDLKELEDYYKHKAMSDGHLGKCKSCCKKDATSNRNKNIEKARKYDRERGNRQGSNYLKDYRKRNPKKYKAQCKVGNAIRGGLLKKMPCEVCGNTHSVGHHDDYDKPLDVRWLCQQHHKQWHAVNGEGLNG